MTRTRSIVLPVALRGTDLEIYVYHLGGPAGGGTARDATLEYLPWARGGYWALACNPDECFVIAATACCDVAVRAAATHGTIRRSSPTAGPIPRRRPPGWLLPQNARTATFRCRK